MSKTVQVPANVVTAISYLHGDVLLPSEVEDDYRALVSEWLESSIAAQVQAEPLTVWGLMERNRKAMSQPCYSGYVVAWPKLERDW
mgnify:CR=1 FL=1